jgi:hypothetical protein
MWQSDHLNKSVIDPQYLYNELGSWTTPFPILVQPAITNASHSHVVENMTIV